jgi:hypothetical protein
MTHRGVETTRTEGGRRTDEAVREKVSRLYGKCTTAQRQKLSVAHLLEKDMGPKKDTRAAWQLTMERMDKVDEEEAMDNQQYEFKCNRAYRARTALKHKGLTYPGSGTATTTLRTLIDECVYIQNFLWILYRCWFSSFYSASNFESYSGKDFRITHILLKILFGWGFPNYSTVVGCLIRAKISELH